MPNLPTPWGRADHVRKLTIGITAVGTPSHGGFRVSRGVAQLMGPLASIGEAWGRDMWFEEDVTWSAVALAFPALFTPAQRASATHLIMDYYPDVFETFSGVAVKLEDSFVRRREVFKQGTAHKFVVWSAVSLGNGMVRCHAKKAATGDERVLLVPRDLYRARGEFGYVVPSPLPEGVTFEE